jgi:hypothetical protein
MRSPTFKKFNHELVVLPDLQTETIDGKRHYVVSEEKKLPSVTTVLSSTADMQWLKEWKDRIGEDEAERQSTRAKNRGTALHNVCEKYVLNELKEPVADPFAWSNFLPVKEQLDRHCDDITLVEGCLWSEQLKIAGRCDLIAGWKRKPAIIDYKTSGKEKDKSHITEYFLQASIYSYMFWERTGILINDIVILICVENLPYAQVFEEKATNYLKKARARIRAYEALS